ncbi:MAG: protease Do [Opitutaceae bacterium]|nr:protease Do [Opitutaceae bacterium]|tara:strand:- start:3652 stop:5109 length:1458 start_codon:yes stop_codon:yes gene_type:complete
MKIRYFVLVYALIIAALGIAHAVTKSESRGLPEISWDSTPLDRSNKHPVSSYADILDQVTPAVVSVSTSKILEAQRYSLPPQFRDDPFLRRFFGVPEKQEDQPRAEGLGSGVIVSRDGYILTNNHVIENVDEVSVRLQDGRQFDAEIIGADSKTDVAVLKIEGNDLPALTLADSDQARVGDVVFAVGNPLRVGLTVTQGIVSATNRTELSLIEEGGYENFLQTDASINPGNSGGPLVDAQGRILGINTAILSQSGGSIGIGFAIPTNLAKNIMMSLIETGEVSRGYLGVSIGALDRELAEQFEVDDTNGAVISQVFPNTPAQTAGLEVYDVIIAINGRTVSSSSDLRLKISQVHPGSEVVMTVIRNGDSMEIPVVVGNLNDAGKLSVADAGSEPVELLEGVTLAEMSEALRQQFRVGQSIRGLVVTEVSGDSPFSDNLMPGMVIMGINRKKVETLSEAYDLLTPGKNLLYVYYEGRNNFLVIRKD